MTTNHPEKLDPALIRPGRVDLQVQFTLATRAQTRDIFKRMYSSSASLSFPPPQPAKRARPSTPTKQPALSSTREDEEFLELLTREPKWDVVELEQLGEMAEEFARAIPEGKFSPAEIQGFLLTRKKEPRRALAEVEGWREAELRKRREKGRG
jgi:chaperone BCS1